MMKYAFSPRPGAYYYRRNGKYWGRLPGLPGSIEFAKAYTEIHATFARPGSTPAAPGTFEHMAQAYMRSAEFLTNLKPKTRAAYRHDLDTLRRDFGPLRPDQIETKHVLKMRDAHASKPGKANTLVRTLSVVYKWGKARGMCKSNPADLASVNVKALRIGEHKAWPPESLDKFRSDGAPNLVLAMELALWLGQRQGDLIRIRWNDIRDGRLRMVQEKTGKELWLPIAQQLADVLAAAPRPAVTVLVNSNGTPWKNANALSQAFAAELTRLKIEGMVFHGLRKTTAVVLAEAGCSTKQIAAVTGQSDQMVEHYAKMADRERLAEAAVTKLERKLIRRPICTDTVNDK
jgi:integrase